MLDTPAISIKFGFLEMTGYTMTGVLAVVAVIVLVLLFARLKT
jgi:hypothetical protein